MAVLNAGNADCTSGMSEELYLYWVANPTLTPSPLSTEGVVGVKALCWTIAQGVSDQVNDDGGVGGGGGGGSITIATTAALSGAGTGTSFTLGVNFGSSAGTVCEGNDARLSNARAPSGAAGGDLSGTYPNPTVARTQGIPLTADTPEQDDGWIYDAATSSFKLEHALPRKIAKSWPLAGAAGAISGDVNATTNYPQSLTTNSGKRGDGDNVPFSWIVGKNQFNGDVSLSGSNELLIPLFLTGATIGGGWPYTLTAPVAWMMDLPPMTAFDFDFTLGLADIDAFWTTGTITVVAELTRIHGDNAMHRLCSVIITKSAAGALQHAFQVHPANSGDIAVAAAVAGATTKSYRFSVDGGAVKITDGGVTKAGKVDLGRGVRRSELMFAVHYSTNVNSGSNGPNKNLRLSGLALSNGRRAAY